MSKPTNLTRPDIALICRDLGIGGVERIWINLANGFAQRGLRVDLVLLNMRASHLSSTLEPRVNIVNLSTKSSSFPKMFTMSFQSSGSIFKLAHYLKQERPRALLAAAHYVNELAILAKLIARVNTRVIVSEHVNVTQELSQGVRSSNRLIPMTIRLLHRFADDIVAVSQGVAEDLRQYGLRNRSIKVIYNPIISDSFYRQAEEKIEFPWEQDASCPVILSCARFVPHKHFEHIIYAFNRVLNQRPARLVLIGDGPEHPRIRHLVKELGLEESVWMPGFVENVYAYMRHADLFAFASSNEGFGNVLVEAIALGLPVVSTDCPSGPSEVLGKGAYGRLVPIGDVESMAMAMIEILQNPPPPTPQSWLEQFTTDFVTRQYLAVAGIPETLS